MWLIVLVSVLAYLAYFVGIKPYKYWTDRNIPYVRPLPLFGNLALTALQRKSFPDLLQDIYNSQSDKRYVGIYQFMFPVLLIRDPELIRQILVKRFDAFPEHKSFASKEVDPLWSKNLFATQGEKEWHEMRSILSPSFTSSKMKMMFKLMKNCSKQFLKHCQKESGFVTLEMKDTFTKFANDVIASTAFGIDCNSLANPNNEFFLMSKDATNFTGLRSLRFFMSSISPTLMKLLNIGIFSKEVSTFFRGVIKQTISVRENHGVVRPDIVHYLMEARKGRQKDDESSNNVSDLGFAVAQELKSIDNGSNPETPVITDEDITAQALMLIVGGFETASTFMCFTAYELAVNPVIQDRLRKEIDKVYKNSNDDISYEDLLEMKYLDMVVTESLRKWPPVVFIDRLSVKAYTIEPVLPGEKRVTLEKGTNLLIPIYPIQRDSNYYEDPENFDPGRCSGGNKQNGKATTYIPFGLGPRSCIASRFSLLVGKLIIAEIIRNFEIVPVERTQIPVKLKKDSFTPVAEKGFWLGLKPRVRN